MKISKFFLLVALCFAAANADVSGSIPVGPYISSSDAPTSPPKPTTSSEPTPTTTIKPPTTPTTTIKPPTTPTTTIKPPTTTSKPPITTSKSTTTDKPTTTTNKPSPTTPAPTPSKPDVGTWNVTDPITNKTCIMARMAMQIEVDYVEKNVTKNVVLNVPGNSSASGRCVDNSQTFSISWNATKNTTDSVKFTFVKNVNTSEVSLGSLQVMLNGIHFSNETKMEFLYVHPEFEAPLEHSYKCNKEQVLALNRSSTMSTNCTAVLRVSELQIQAFRNSTTNQFDDAIDCIHSTTSDIVPIAVGCALAALVVIVLLAYLYGRRRSQARGYLSM
ncbi:hypothetical protein WA026_020296 [Henosepilachna vigintioctopunctata]